jgi:large subunit ribosomal protein L2
MKVVSGDRCDPDLGNCMRLDAIPLGLQVHNVELQPGRGGQVARSAGNSVPADGARRRIRRRRDAFGRDAQDPLAAAAPRSARSATPTGRTSAGARPAVSATSAAVRTTAAPPRTRSHPMGGGEGRTGGGRHPCSPTGLLAKGGKTRRGKARSNQFILRRRPPGKHVAVGSGS